MNNKLFLRLLMVIAIFGVSLYYSLVKPIKLGLDLKGGAYVVLEAVEDENSNVKIDNDAMNRLIEVLNRRVNGIGVAESTIQKAGDNRVIIELPGLQDTEEAINLIGKTALMEFKLMNEDGSLGETLLTGSALKKEIENLEIIEVDERFSTVIADNILKELNKNGAIEKRKVVDKVAASIILQTYLDMKKLKFLEEGKE